MDSSEEMEKDTLSLANVVQLVDEEMQMYENAQALLGSADDKVCTYYQGYIDRQALYSCRTCRTDSGKPSGVCLACSLQCHDGHDLIELYTKRNFRCDCGNSLFPDNFKCKLDPKKSAINDLNIYNQNFDGIYCICSRPYPDYEDSIEDIMIQCIICEDWLHGRHATSTEVNSFEFEEMICKNCLLKNSFLLKYIQLCNAICFTSNSFCNHLNHDEDEDRLSTEQTKNANDNSPYKKEFISNEISDQLKVTDGVVSGDNTSSYTTSLNASCMMPPGTLSVILSTSSSICRSSVIHDTSSYDYSSSSVTPSTSLQVDILSPRCVLTAIRARDIDYANGAVFWPGGWREKLCKCCDCLALYANMKLNFLPKSEDTLKHYESKSKTIDSIASQHIAQMNHVQKIELVQGYMDLKNGLTEYLKKFENGKVVREEDILEFFEGLQSRKKRKIE